MSSSHEAIKAECVRRSGAGQAAFWALASAVGLPGHSCPSALRDHRSCARAAARAATARCDSRFLHSDSLFFSVKKICSSLSRLERRVATYLRS